MALPFCDRARFEFLLKDDTMRSGNSVKCLALYAAVLAVCTGCPGPIKEDAESVPGTAIVLHHDFEAYPVGAYTLAHFIADWRGSTWELGVLDARVSIVGPPDAYRGKAMRILYPEGAISFGKSGASWKVALGESYDELYGAFRIRFSPEFDFASGGVLPGFIGGRGTIDGHRPIEKEGWSARMLWLENGAAAQVVYDQNTTDGDRRIYAWTRGTHTDFGQRCGRSDFSGQNVFVRGSLRNTRPRGRPSLTPASV